MESTRSRLASGSVSGILWRARVVLANDLMADAGSRTSRIGEPGSSVMPRARVLVEPQRFRCAAQGGDVGEAVPLALDALPVGRGGQCVGSGGTGDAQGAEQVDGGGVLAVALPTWSSFRTVGFDSARMGRTQRRRQAQRFRGAPHTRPGRCRPSG